jgi:uncharacterized protein YndB with AHSA1/START domain
MIAALLLLALAPDLTTEKALTPLSITYDVTVERPLADVWDAWATEAGAQQFFAPKVRIEGHVGGAYEVRFEPGTDPEGRHHGTFGCRLLKRVPLRELAFEWTVPPLGPETNTQPFPTWVEVKLEPAPGAPGHTRVRFAHHGFPDTKAWRQAFALFRDTNWPIVLSRLVAWGRDGVPSDWNAPPGERLGRFVRTEVTVDASLADAWAAWTTEAGVRRWFAPGARVGSAPGDPYEIYFLPDAPEGQRGGEGNRVLASVPQRQFVFTWNAPPSLPGVREKRTVTDLRFEPLGPRQTRVTLTALGFGAGGEWERSRAYFEAAWPRVLESFAASLAAPGATR